MNYLSLFSGAGGFDLACQALLGWECKGYLDHDKACTEILDRRIRDGLLSDAPVFHCDIASFLRDYARSYQGMVDAVVGGFPCQPFSQSGKRRAEDDHRNQWPATAECIRLVRPRYAFLENVPTLLTLPYFGRILGDLAALGYGVRWDCISASACGAFHRRERLWIVADAEGARREVGLREASQKGQPGALCRRMVQPERADRLGIGNRGWPSEPDVDRMVHGMAEWMDRIRALGNGVVPRVAATAWEILT